MTAPTSDPRQSVPPYVALVRIVAVIGMSLAIATGICLLLLSIDYFIWGFVSIAMALPFFWLMRLAERLAGEPPAPGL